MVYPQWAWIAAQLASRRPAKDPFIEARWAELDVFIRAYACQAFSLRPGIDRLPQHSPFSPLVDMLVEAQESMEGNPLISLRVSGDCDLLYHIANLAWSQWSRPLANTAHSVFTYQEKVALTVIARHWGPEPDGPVYVRPIIAADLAVCLKSPSAQLRECTLRLLPLLPLAPAGQITLPHDSPDGHPSALTVGVAILSHQKTSA